MTVEVLYFAELKDITKKNKELFEISSSNIKELIEILFNKYRPLKNLLWDATSKKLRKSISIAINDALISLDDKLSYSLRNGDKIAFLLPMSGG